ncbi:hypothetical protein Pan216_04270 [Planctomycetes bacterium Pan216]|uniref:Nickel uptake substrate-specific transmembrane region n=1 Tax=Kolteria novifilia TaxID=2527975 RepID=A0A518AXY9_9BACT|nr:hypothetical protein Pan216_04270 [Planctomycetes bacterium Pan216]
MTYVRNLGLGLVAVAIVASGCSKSADPTSTAKQTGAEKESAPAKKEEHAPHGAGPNGGVVFDLGKHHAEFTVDHPKKECMILILGTDEKTPTPVATEELVLTTKETKTEDGTIVAPMTIKMLPKDGKEGKATTFVGTDPGIGNIADFDGTVLAMIDGKPSQGEFSESHGSAGHSHSHGADDALVWEGEPKIHSGTTIRLGHHGEQLRAGTEVEPAVSIERDGKPVSDAKVFNALVSADGKTVLASEVPTVYEPTTEDEPAHYAQGALAIPKDVNKVVIRFRIVLPNAAPVTYDVPVNVE